VNLRPSRLTCLKDYIIAFGLLALYFFADRVFGVPWFVGVAVLVFSAALILSSEIFLRTNRYRITPEKITVETGIFTRKRQSVFVDSVSNVSLIQGSVDLLLGVGSVVIDSRAGKDSRIILSGVRKPKEIAKKIEKLATRPPER